MSKYYEWKGFENIYLEDSFVLDIEESDSDVSFTMDIVLKENHPLYEPPKETGQYCYKKAKLVFNNVKNVNWLQKNNKPYTDAAGEIDYGNIDSLKISDGIYSLSGDWGCVEIASSPVKLVWL